MERWDDLRYLVAVQKTGTMSGAARLLGANVGTVSRRIERLGTDLGVQPFLKTPDGWQPNPLLGGLIEAATDFENRISVELNRRNDRHLSGSISLRMGCPPLVSILFLLPGLPELRRSAPEIQLTLTQNMFNSTLGENDVIITSQLPERGRLMTRKIGSIRFGLYRPSQHPCRGEWISLLPEFEHTVPARMGNDYYQRPPVIRLENYYYIAEAMQATGLGGPLPERLAEKVGQFTRIESGNTALEREPVNLWLCYHETRRGDPAIEAVTTWVTDCLQDADVA